MSLGTRARFAFWCQSSSSITALVGNPGGSVPSIQVVCNSTIVGEYATTQSISIPVIAGYNVLQLVVPDGGILCNMKALGSTVVPVSIYPEGSDLFQSVQAGGSSGGISIPVSGGLTLG